MIEEDRREEEQRKERHRCEQTADRVLVVAVVQSAFSPLRPIPFSLPCLLSFLIAIDRFFKNFSFIAAVANSCESTFSQYFIGAKYEMQLSFCSHKGSD